MDNLILVRIPRPSVEQRMQFRSRMAELAKEVSVRANVKEDMLVYVASSLYMFDAIVTVLRGACIPYTLHAGQKIRGGNSCGVSITSSIAEVALMSEAPPTSTVDCTTTTTGSAKP